MTIDLVAVVPPILVVLGSSHVSGSQTLIHRSLQREPMDLSGSYGRESINLSGVVLGISVNLVGMNPWISVDLMEVNP